MTNALVRLDFDCPVWYQKHFIEVSQPHKLCLDYWTIARRHNTYRDALRARGMRWALYSVYVVQRCRKMRWEAIEVVLREYPFPRKLYCRYMYLLWFTGRLSRGGFEAAVKNTGQCLDEVDLPITQHWQTQYALELKALEGL